jgi:CubicO group peptidase (beta-lactamase class C family)
MRSSVSLIVMTAVADLSTVQAQAPVTIEVKRGVLAQTIDAVFAERAAGGFSGAVIVEDHGVVILKAGYGWANRARRIPFTASTIAQVGSLTKQFTAAAVVDLATQGKLGFDDALARHMARVPPAAADLTIHQLLTHTAGLPPACGGDFDRVTRNDLVSRCLANLTPRPAPAFAYSNLGYSLLGAVVEQVSGRPVEAYLAGRFFKPLGMTRTGYFFGDALQDSLAAGDTGGDPQPPISDRLRGLAPAFWNLKGNGGMQASTEDMYTWYRALSNGPVFTAPMRLALMTPHVQRDAEVGYGYGWFVRAGPDGRVEQVSHTGSDGVFFSAFVWRPLDRTFYYMVTSSGEKTGAEVASLVLRRLREGTPANP